MWDELADADETIHFAMFFWTDELLSKRVAERIEAGVEVYGVWDQLGAAKRRSFLLAEIARSGDWRYSGT